MKLINGHIYWYGIGRISNSFNSPLDEVLSCASAIILTISFCEVKIFPLLKVLPQKKLFHIL